MWAADHHRYLEIYDDGARTAAAALPERLPCHAIIVTTVVPSQGTVRQIGEQLEGDIFWLLIIIAAF